MAYVVIMAVIITVGTVWGLTLLSNISIFWDTVRGGGSAAQTTNHIVGAPTLNSLPLYSNKAKIPISGTGEAGAVVTIYRNEQKIADQLVGNDGQFSFNGINLKAGENIFTAKQSIDTSESPESKAASVTLDMLPPKLSVDKPADGSSSNSQYIFVSGHADTASYVMINDHQSVVGQDGLFNGVAQLQNGSNKVTVTATDDAGNKTTVVKTVNYTP
jgi:bacillopeptidase F